MAKSPEVERLTWTPAEVAVALGISERTVYSMIRDGQLPGVVRIGRRLFVFQQTLIDALLRGTGADPDAELRAIEQQDAATTAKATAKANANAAEGRQAVAAARKDGWLT